MDRNVGQAELSGLKVLVVGLGSIGRRHARNLRGLGISHLTAYRTRQGALRGDEDLEGMRIFRSLQEALEDRPDVVFVTNPTSLHLPVALECLQANSHLFIEKPISHELNGVDELLAAAEQRKLLIGIGYDMRSNVAIRALKGVIEDGRLGRILSAQLEVGSYLPAWHPWEDYRMSYAARADLGGGVVLTLSHEIDLIRWLLGEVESVSAEMDHLSRLEVDVEDVAALLMRFRSGAIGTVYLDYLQRASHRRCRVVGEEGAVEWSEREGASTLSNGESTSVIGRESPDSNAPFIEEIRDFLGAVARRSTPSSVASGRDGERVLAVIAAARESVRSGGRVRVESPAALPHAR